jgi:hypothetical protein
LSESAYGRVRGNELDSADVTPAVASILLDLRDAAPAIWITLRLGGLPCLRGAYRGSAKS